MSIICTAVQVKELEKVDKGNTTSIRGYFGYPIYDTTIDKVLDILVEEYEAHSFPEEGNFLLAMQQKLREIEKHIEDVEKTIAPVRLASITTKRKDYSKLNPPVTEIEIKLQSSKMLLEPFEKLIAKISPSHTTVFGFENS